MEAGSNRLMKQQLQVFDENHFVLWNEPDMAYPFLFNYVAGNEWRTQKLVKESIQKYFTNTPGGIPGNDDCGTTSAWLVFAMLGLYPVCPASGDYAVIPPVFNEVSITLNPKYYKGKKNSIKKRGSFADNFLFKQPLINGKLTDNYFISHKTITNGVIK